MDLGPSEAAVQGVPRVAAGFRGAAGPCLGASPSPWEAPEAWRAGAGPAVVAPPSAPFSSKDEGVKRTTWTFYWKVSPQKGWMPRGLRGPCGDVGAATPPAVLTWLLPRPGPQVGGHSAANSCRLPSKAAVTSCGGTTAAGSLSPLPLSAPGSAGVCAPVRCPSSSTPYDKTH